MGGGAWPFLVGGAICLVNSDNERDSVLLTRRVLRRPWMRAAVSAVVRAAVTGETVSPHAVGRRPRLVIVRRCCSRCAVPARRVSAWRFGVVAAGGAAFAPVADGRTPLIGLPPADEA